MNETNLKTLKHFGVVALMFIIGLLAIASNAAVWNAVAGGTENLGGSEVAFSVLNLIAEGGLLWFFGKKMLPKVSE